MIRDKELAVPGSVFEHVVIDMHRRTDSVKALGLTAATQLAQHYSELANEFICVFSRDTPEGPVSIAAVGSQFEIEAVRLNDTVTFHLRQGEDQLLSASFTIDPKAGHYSQLFHNYSMFISQVQSTLAARCDLPNKVFALGGWVCATNPQQVAQPLRFSIPKIAVQITQYDTTVFSFSRQYTNVVSDIVRTINVPNDSTSCSWQIVAQQNVPECHDYVDGLVQMITEISGEARDKVVLGREVRLRTSEDVCPLGLLRAVASTQINRYEYLFRWAHDDAWVGISPETLVRVAGDIVTVEPLAGTRKGAASAEKHSHYRHELTTDAKEIEEHDTAVNMFEEAMRDVCIPGTLHVDKVRDVLDLGYVQHLRSKMVGTIRSNYDVFNVLAAIYPPATIWGKPVETAGARLRCYEKIDRGYFAGGLGMCRLDGEADFALAIRSACVNGNEIKVYAGSGIVKGSDPYREWLETRNKMRPFLDNPAFSNT